MTWTSDVWGWGSALMMVGLMALWVVIVGAAIWGVAALTRSGAATPLMESARVDLDRRFAAGEMDESEYARARHLMDAGRGT